jgi:peptidoglycan hydrolase-like protein with peptidoglycan-binding domain
MASRLLVLFALVACAGCQLENRSADRPDAPPVTNADAEVSVYGDSDRTPTDADVEAGRRDSSWRGFVGRESDYPVDTSAAGAEPAPAPRPTRADTAAYAEALGVPLSSDTDGRAVLYAQILLDRARFSPGQIDGRWGQNTEKAVYWLQRREGLDASGTLDRPTLQRLVQLADAPRSPDSLLVLRTLTADEVEGPFEEIPDDIYAKAEMERLPYQSLGEKLGEAYHVAPSLLREWHGSALDSLAAGDTLRVPNLRQPTFDAEIDRLVVSDGGRYLHALDAQGRILAHFPSTLGSDYDPSPSETQEIVSITDYPGWHYQPDILADVDDSEEDAHIPPGPNNAVGVVWMELSKEHYGIHGTAHPETIGHTASAGCVRLTNWDAQTLAKHVEPGIEVAFRGTDGRGEQANAADSTAASRSRP